MIVKISGIQFEAVATGFALICFIYTIFKNETFNVVKIFSSVVGISSFFQL